MDVGWLAEPGDVRARSRAVLAETGGPSCPLGSEVTAAGPKLPRGVPRAFAGPPAGVGRSSGDQRAAVANPRQGLVMPVIRRAADPAVPDPEVPCAAQRLGNLRSGEGG
jgi:hypothetical protein